MQMLADRVLHWAEVHAQKLALDDGISTLNYGQLGDKARLVAQCLASMGVGVGDRVVILLPKNCDAVAAVIGVLLAGATYIPMDLSAPRTRLQSVLGDSQPKALICNDETGTWFEELAHLNLNPDRCATLELDRPTHAAVAIESDAYVLYTSGSTGVPNGVRISHRAMLAFFSAVNSFMGISHHSRCMNTSALYFDVSIVDIMLPLYQGAAVWLGPERPLPFRFLGLISNNRITHFCAVGSTLTMLSALPNFGKNAWPHITRIMTGAEVLNPQTMMAWLNAAPDAVILNGYGPTEATCVCTIFEITREIVREYASYPIGRPLPAVEVLIDRHGDEDAQEGELCVAGPQVMSGYLNRSALNDERFFIQNQRLFYRTGDKVCHDERGNLRFLGRIDDQVKVRGYRIHLDDVAEPFRRIAGVQEAVAVPLRHVQHGECIAIVIKADRPGIDLLALKELGSTSLPAYMKPKFIGEIADLPLKASGKTDVKMIRTRAVEYFQDSDEVAGRMALDAMADVS